MLELSAYPREPREFGLRRLPPHGAEVPQFQPCEFDHAKVDPKWQWDIFVKDPNNKVVSGWHHVSTENCAEWVWTIQNMIRAERPSLMVRALRKPRSYD